MIRWEISITLIKKISFFSFPFSLLPFPSSAIKTNIDISLQPLIFMQEMIQFTGFVKQDSRKISSKKGCHTIFKWQTENNLYEEVGKEEKSIRKQTIPFRAYPLIERKFFSFVSYRVDTSYQVWFNYIISYEFHAISSNLHPFYWVIEPM